MDFQSNEYAGVPYDDIKWYDVTGQPFGIASSFNAIILGDADNIVDTKGAMAVGGNFISQRGLSLGYGNEGNLRGTGYSPDFVRFLVGGNVIMQGPLVVIGHVVAGGSFKTARGSTYMIGKDGTEDQVKELTALYQANGGSKYWRVSDRENHYAISSYDVPRFIPASRINADTGRFFTDAEESLANYHDCIANLQPNGRVTEHYHEWILQGSDPDQNVFLIDVSTNGILDKEIRFEIPQGSLAIVIFKTGNSAHLRYGLWGDKQLANRTLYVFEDAEHIHMEVPAAIWGSIFAPRAMFHAHPTGGTVNGNAALGTLKVPPTSGFEFHLYPFIGGVKCRTRTQTPAPAPEVPPMEEIPSPPVQEIPQEIPTPPVQEVPQEIPTPVQEVPREIPTPPVQEVPREILTPPIQKVPREIPIPPVQEVPQQVPTPFITAPCPECPPEKPCPIPAPCPQCPPQAPCPAEKPCPIIPPCPAEKPCPIIPPCPECPQPETCPEARPCPPCPAPQVKIQPVPIPIPIPCPEQEKCDECLITPGIIFGCIWGCRCGDNHEWEIKLYRKCGDNKELLYCIRNKSCSCFEFHVPYNDFYLLEICPVSTSSRHKHCRCGGNVCKPMITLKNVGVANLIME